MFLKKICIVFCLINYRISAQTFSYFTSCHSSNYTTEKPLAFSKPIEEKFKIRKQGFGTILGVQRGEITNLTFGSEYHWRKIRLSHPSMWAANAAFEYNIGNNILGFRTGFFYKIGRIALTYGASACYLTDFENNAFGVTPAMGFRLIGFHLQAGYNLLVNAENLKKYNTFQISLNYYFPIFSDTDIKRNHKKKKKDKDEKKPFWKNIFKKKDKS
jgi:hypothetical protein